MELRMFYLRNFETVAGKLKELRIQKDRERKFKKKLIEQYKRRDISLGINFWNVFIWNKH